MHKFYIALILLSSACTINPSLDTITMTNFQKEIAGDYLTDISHSTSLLQTINASIIDKTWVSINNLNFSLPTAVEGENIEFIFVKKFEQSDWHAYAISYNGIQKYIALSLSGTAFNKKISLHSQGFTDSLQELSIHDDSGVNMLVSL